MNICEFDQSIDKKQIKKAVASDCACCFIQWTRASRFWEVSLDRAFRWPSGQIEQFGQRKFKPNTKWNSMFTPLTEALNNATLKYQMAPK